MLAASRERVQERGVRLIIALPNFVARRHAALDLCGQKLVACLRHAVAGIHNRAGRTLGRLSDAPLRATLRETRARLEGTAARLAIVTDIAGWQAHVEHGDGLRPREDKRYRMLRSVLRNTLAIRTFRWLHPDLATPIATSSSHASRSYVARDAGRGLRTAAERISAADPALDLVVLGHSHVHTLERLPQGAIYGNPGSWLDAPTFLRITEEQVSLRQWDGSAESADLHTFHRSAKKALAEL